MDEGVLEQAQRLRAALYKVAEDALVMKTEKNEDPEQLRILNERLVELEEKVYAIVGCDEDEGIKL